MSPFASPPVITLVQDEDDITRDILWNGESIAAVLLAGGFNVQYGYETPPSVTLAVLTDSVITARQSTIAAATGDPK